MRDDDGLGLDFGLGVPTGLGGGSLGTDVIEGDFGREGRVCSLRQPRAPQPDQQPDTQQRQKHQKRSEHNEIRQRIGLWDRLDDDAHNTRRNIREIRDHLFHGISLTSKRLI